MFTKATVLSYKSQRFIKTMSFKSLRVSKSPGSLSVPESKARLLSGRKCDAKLGNKKRQSLTKYSDCCPRRQRGKVLPADLAPTVDTVEKTTGPVS